MGTALSFWGLHGTLNPLHGALRGPWIPVKNLGPKAKVSLSTYPSLTEHFFICVFSFCFSVECLAAAKKVLATIMISLGGRYHEFRDTLNLGTN